MTTTKIYKQKVAGPCADYAILAVCDRIGVDVNEEYMLSTKEIGLINVCSTLMKDGKIKGYGIIRNASTIDVLLKRGQAIATGTGKMDFEEVRNSPYIAKLEGKKGHNFAIVEDLGDKWKIQDSQGENFGDGGYWYLPKTMFNKLKTPIRLLK